MTESKSGDELAPQRGAKGSETARRFFRFFGLGVEHRHSDPDD